MYTYRHPRPAVSADIVLVAGLLARGAQASRGEAGKVLLVRRKHEPFEGSWALPGGFMEEGETLEATAVRELAEETGVSGVALEQVRAFSEPDRDPRGRVVSVAFAGAVEEPLPLAPADDASDARWWPLGDLPPLAFDHDAMIAAALAWLGGDGPATPTGQQGHPEEAAP